MMTNVSWTATRRVFLLVCFATLFAWISFVPLCRSWTGRIILFAALLGGIIWEKRSARFLWEWNNWPLWLLLLGFTGGMKNAANRAAAWPYYLHLVILLAALFYIGKGLFEDKRTWKPLLVTISVLSSCIALYAIVEAVLGFNPLYEYWIESSFYNRYAKVHTPMATQFHPAALATYLLLCFPFSLFLSRCSEGWSRRLGAIGLVLSLPAFFITLSRSSFIGLLAMTVVYQIIRQSYRKLTLLVTGLFLFVSVASFMPPPLYRMGFKGILTWNGGIFSEYRLERISMSLTMLREHPICGIGIFHFKFLFPRYYPHPGLLKKVPYEQYVADNMYPTLLGETGLLGLGSFLVFAGMLLLNGWLVYRRTPDEQRRYLLLVSQCSLVGLLLSMAGYDLFYWPGPYMLFALVCGILAGVTQAREASARDMQPVL